MPNATPFSTANVSSTGGRQTDEARVAVGLARRGEGRTMSYKGWFIKEDQSGLGPLGVIFMVVVIGWLVVMMLGNADVSAPTGPSYDTQQCPASYAC
jgi:hypothetical protein